MLKSFGKEIRPARVLIYQNAGFLAIIAASMFIEFAGVTRLIFGDEHLLSDFQPVILNAVLILSVWLLVNISTRRLLHRNQHLEEFLRVCAWCRRIYYKDRWIRLEEFMQEGLDTPTSHGICKECKEQQMKALEQARQQQIKSAA